jgi:hypothetical protein
VCVIKVRRDAYRALVGKPEERRPLERPGIDGRIILTRIFERLDGGGGVWTGSIWLRTRTCSSEKAIKQNLIAFEQIIITHTTPKKALLCHSWCASTGVDTSVHNCTKTDINVVKKSADETDQKLKI